MLILAPGTDGERAAGLFIADPGRDQAVDDLPRVAAHRLGYSVRLLVVRRRFEVCELAVE